VSYLAAVRTTLITLLVLAVTLKVSFYGRNEAPVADFKGHVGGLLRENGFVVTDVRADQALFQTLSAQSGSCEMSVSSISPHGWERDTIWRSARPDSQVVFIYKGQRYGDQPAWRSFADFYLSRASRLIGAATPLRPVVAVIATPECKVSDMRWLENAS
jgi:hypothetical protein